ncbi:MAG: TIGR00266 family protein [Candidatus Riflebacteria bacterium]
MKENQTQENRMSDAKMWYLAVAGQAQGPMGREDVIQKLRSGSVNKNTMVYCEGVTQNWTPLESISDFAAELGHGSFMPPIPTTRCAPSKADEVDFCVYGDDLQFVEIELDPGESVVAEAGAMIFMDSTISMETILGDGSEEQSGFWGKLAGAGKRLLTGESLFMTVFTNKGGGKSKVAFGGPFPGKIIAIDLRDVNGKLVCQKDSFLCGAKGVSVGIELQKKIGMGLFGGEGFIMQKLEGDGLVFCHAGGSIYTRDLAAGEVIKVDTGCIVAHQSGVSCDIEMVKGIKNMFFGGEGMFLATMKGPGRIWLQSLPFSRLAGRIIAAAPQTGNTKQGEGSVLGGVFNAISGD